MPLFTIARFTVIEAVRNRMLWLVASVLIGSFGLAEFLSEVAITESAHYQSGFFAAIIRTSAVFTLSLFVITSMVREFNDKGVELILSLPIPRATYLLGKLLGFSILAWALALLCALSLLVYVPAEQALIWGVSLGFELFLMTALSLLCLVTFNQITWALSTVTAFYVLARSISDIQLMGHGPLASSTSIPQYLINALIDAMAYLLPELHRFTLSDWVIYHSGQLADLWPIAAQSLIYVTLLCAAALFDLYRKNF